MKGNAIRPLRNGFLEQMMNFFRHQNKAVLMMPLNIGETNHESTIVPSVPQFKPCMPRATKLNPMVEPTMLWVPEIGSLRNVAANSHTALLLNAAKQPSISSFSLP